MLTIKPPIQLRCRFPMEAVHNDLAEKIMGNYTLMNNFIRKEELLYVTTQAPEVYFAEGSSISILNDIKNENKQEVRLDIINHLINRILMSHTDNFSYQDNVYISNVLRKLGIQDISNFMKQVYKLREEKTENNQLIDIYEQQKNVLMNIFKEESIHTDKKKKNKEEKNIYENRYYIHEEIFNRLNTKNVYEDIRNYTQGIDYLNKKITNNEIAISEQVSMIQNFNLHELKKKILNNEAPLYYYHVNQYEMIEADSMEGTDAEARISAAILLNLVDNIYALRLKQIENNSHNWYSVAGALFKSAENTWQRYEINHKEGKKVTSNMYNTMVEIVNSKKNERNIISNIVNEISVLNEEKIETFHQDELNEMYIKNNIYNIVKEVIFKEDGNDVLNTLEEVLIYNQGNRVDKKYIENLINEFKIIKNEIRNEEIKVIKNVNEIVKQENQADVNIENNEEIINRLKNEITNITPEVSTFIYNGLIDVINNSQFDNSIISNIVNEINALNEERLETFHQDELNEMDIKNNLYNIIKEVILKTEGDDVLNNLEEVLIYNQKNQVYKQYIEKLINEFKIIKNEIRNKEIKSIENVNEIIKQTKKADINIEKKEELINILKNRIINISPEMSNLIYNSLIEVINNNSIGNKIGSNIVNEINNINEVKNELLSKNNSNEIFIKNNIYNIVKEAIFSSDENYISSSFEKVFNYKYENEINELDVNNLINELNILKNEIKKEDIKVIKNISEIINNTKNVNVDIENNEVLINSVKDHIINDNPKISTFMYNGLIEVINNNPNDNRIISEIINEISVLNDYEQSNENSEFVDEMTVIKNIQNILEDTVYFNNDGFSNDIFNRIINENSFNKEMINHTINKLIKNLEVDNRFQYEENVRIINNLSEIVQKNINENITYLNEDKIISDIRTEIINNKPSFVTNMYSGLVEVINNTEDNVSIISDLINDIKLLNEQREIVDSTDEEELIINKVQTKLENIINYNYEKKENTKIINNMNNQSTDIQINKNDVQKMSSEIKYVNNNYFSEDIDVISRLNSIAGQTDITVMNNFDTENIINSLNNEFNIFGTKTDSSYESISELVHTNNVSEEENIENITEINQETLKYFDEINRKNIENYKKILEIENQRPTVKNVSLNKERARKDALRALENPELVLNEIINSEVKDEHTEINFKLNEEIYNLFSDETKNIFEQIVRQKNGEAPIQFVEQSVVHRIEEKEDTVDIVKNIVNKEYINEVVNNQNISNFEMTQRPSITYEINETIKNEINELRNMDINYLYENYFAKEEVKKKRGRKSKAAIEKEQKKERENLELQHFMEQVEQEDNIVYPVKPQTIRTKEVGMVHKIEEQIITEDLINTIRNKTIDNVKEDTVEHNQINNINRNEKVINETVNKINVSNQQNIEEIVKQNVKKQLNQITDQVYGKIEKKLQTERKRRGY